MNEHLARYRFAARFADASAHVLDAGCGSGYGVAEFPNAASVVAIDISADTVTHARREYSRPGANFLQGACESLPFADRSFDLVVAFEVLEHLERWPLMLSDASRVLRPSGVLLVSTPNRAWYAESRGAAGPNPYHVREFEYGEFKTALEAVFPHVHLWTQNHSESIAFVPASPSCGVFDAPGDPAPDTAHFFLAACSQSPIAETRAFAWLPVSGNVLRERQRHIALLESEIAESRAKLLAELHESNAWAAGLNTELDVARAAISRLESEADERLKWVHDLKDEIARARAEIERQYKENRDLENTIDERTRWAQRLDAELQEIEHTKWVRLGRKIRTMRTISGKPA
jgi:SAM-dependent methyltransferase